MTHASPGSSAGWTWETWRRVILLGVPAALVVMAGAMAVALTQDGNGGVLVGMSAELVVLAALPWFVFPLGLPGHRATSLADGVLTVRTLRGPRRIDLARPAGIRAWRVSGRYGRDWVFCLLRDETGSSAVLFGVNAIPVGAEVAKAAAKLAAGGRWQPTARTRDELDLGDDDPLRRTSSSAGVLLASVVYLLAGWALYFLVLAGLDHLVG